MIAQGAAQVRVLLVEDDEDDALLTQRLLHGAASGRYLVDWRDSFDTGLAALSENDYDVMLLDFRLSGETGLDLLRAARAKGTQSPAILLTGEIDRDLDILAMEAGVVDFLEKDHLRSAVLERSIRHAAERGRTDRERVLLLAAEHTAREEAESAHAHLAAVMTTLEAERTVLNRSEAFFRAAFLSSSVASILVSVEGLVLQTNRAMCLLLGYSDIELAGKSVLSFTLPPDVKGTEDARQQMLAGMIDMAQLENRYVHKDGHVIDVSVNVGLVRTPDGEPSYFTTQVFDVSDRKRAELDIAIREQRFADIVSVQQKVATAPLQDSSVINVIAESARALTHADSAGVAMFEKNCLVYKAVATNSEALYHLAAGLDSSLAGRCFTERQPMLCSDAETDRFVDRRLEEALNARSVLCVPMFYDNDVAIGVLTVFATRPHAFTDQDIYTLQLMAGLAAAGLGHATDFAAKQALLVERTTALTVLRDREAHITSLLENATDPLITLDEECLISYASPALERLLERPSSDFLGVHPAELCHVDDKAIVAGTFGLMVATRTRNVSIEARFYRKDGRLRTLRINGRNMIDDPAVRGIIVNLHDMTDEADAAAQLRQAEKLVVVGQLAGGVAHDFNNLLTVISGHGEFLAQSIDRKDPRYEDVEQIQLAADRAAALTRQLLAFSRQQMLQPEVVDVNGVVARMEPMLRRLIGEDLTFIITPSPDTANVLADPSQLEQVVMNLCINGRDAMPNGGTLTIDVQVTDLDDSIAMQHGNIAPGRYVMLAITDTGIGMSKETRERIFDPFFTTKESGKGTGLGLSTVYGIVKQSNGYIGVYSEPELWSTFKVYLPHAEAVRTAAPPAETPIDSTGTGTILLVEDEEAVRRISKRILRCQGYRVLEAKDGIHALEVADEFEGVIDLLITDVVMPRMNGRALAYELSQRMPELAILFLSGYTTDEIMRRNPIEMEGRVQLLQKPFTSESLATAARDAIRVAKGAKA